MSGREGTGGSGAWDLEVRRSGLAIFSVLVVGCPVFAGEVGSNHLLFIALLLEMNVGHGRAGECAFRHIAGLSAHYS